MEERLLKLGLVASGGALGSVARYALAVWVQDTSNRALEVGYPLGTTVVNLIGSFAFGVIWTYTSYSPNAAEWRLFLLSGVLGAFTTFSTLMFESAQAAQHGRIGMAIVHLVVHLALGMSAVMLGLGAGRLFIPSQ